MDVQATVVILTIVFALVMLPLMFWLAHWLDGRAGRMRRLEAIPSREERLAAAEADRNPGGPLTEKQARRLLEDILQAAIRQKADAVLFDRLSGRPQVRLQVEGRYLELTGIGDEGSFLRIIAQARSCAGLPGAEVSFRGGGSFLRLYRKPHLETDQWRREDGESSFSYYERARKNRVVRFDLESYPAPGGGALKITLRPETAPESTRFDLGFAREAEERFIRAARSRSGIVLLTGPCNAGKSTATYHLLSLLRDGGRRIATVEWPAERTMKGVEQHDLGDGLNAYDRVGPCLRQVIQSGPDVLLLQNIDWVYEKDAQAAIDFAAAGGLLVTAVHLRDCALGAVSLLTWHFYPRRRQIADLLRIVVAPRRLFMACTHCAEEYRVPAKIFRESGMSDPPTGADGRVSTWRGRGCPMCENTGELGSVAVYEVLDLTGEMKRFIENDNDWNRSQVDYLRRQAWQHGLRTQRELALERVVAGDISLEQALLNTDKPRWLVAAQAARKKANGGKGSRGNG